MSDDSYILVGHDVVAEPDLLTWARWFESADRFVAKTEVGNVRILTVFLGLDYSFRDGDIPIVFETMVRGGEFDEWQRRYCTWEQVAAGHNDWVARLTAGESLDD